MQVPGAEGAGDHLFYFSASLNNTVNEQTIFELSKKIWRQCTLTARRYVLVSVTRRQHRHKSVTVGQKAVTVQGGFGAVFGVQVQILIEAERVAIQS
jgi:hypothetical protein